MAARTSLSKTFVWILLGLLFVGLAGFGATNLSGTVRTVGKAGEQSIGVDQFARELQREINAVISQTGRALPMDQVRAIGLDQQVLARLVALASLDHETTEMGISIGDQNLQQEIVRIPSFQGLDGTFDREAYRFSLQSAGLSEAEFEADLRNEAARTLVQAAILGGVRMPDTLNNVIVEYIGERRSFTWALLDETSLTAPVPTPTEAELRAFYDSNIDRYTLPETRQITYAHMHPADLLDTVEVDETALRDAYAARESEFNQPERRLVERLVFADEAAARDAMAQLEVGGTRFELLVQDRGLDLADVDLGDVTASDLGAASAEVFSADVGDVVGPLPSSLGPALFRVNAVLAAQAISFEEAEPMLRDELAQDRARRQIEVLSQDYEDLLAGGATLEELVAETDMQLGQIAWTDETLDGIAAYGAFRGAAAALTQDDFPEIAFLDDGGLFAIRLDSTLPQRPQPFEDARAEVLTDATRAATEAALEVQAAGMVASLATQGEFAAVGLSPVTETDLTRTAFIEGIPPGLIIDVFEMEQGDLRIVPAEGAVIVLRLDEVKPAETTGDMARLREALSEELNQTLARALFDAYVRDVQFRAEPRIDERALNAVLTSFQ
ncbi:peptidyl-prolyl cis-trans isomerase [Aestuariivita sp.]|jgi:peptidyl-prolyl cis-trans isomerase D|uniref:peptidyl-prolyl cis-trans isomerase n=1 Tax=Aestuariivita sp. TaxID=1872407 RepID=UPI0021720DE8|nr:peptidyl-prolyl cis-trans isomerase [Aestuariivita sp.]MCE8008035.1 peptidylprolyl isomerase [Aestuariivita sp.]